MPADNKVSVYGGTDQVNEDTIDYDKLVTKLIPKLMTAMMNNAIVWGDPSRVHLGQSISLVNTLLNTNSGHIYIEDSVTFSHNVCLLTGAHDVGKRDNDRQRAIPPDGRDIVIRQGAWIASNVTIVGPCEVGRNAVIGAGSVVLKDVKPNWFYAGVPARPIKKVLDD